MTTVLVLGLQVSLAYLIYLTLCSPGYVRYSSAMRLLESSLLVGGFCGVALLGLSWILPEFAPSALEYQQAKFYLAALVLLDGIPLRLAYEKGGFWVRQRFDPHRSLWVSVLVWVNIYYSNKAWDSETTEWITGLNLLWLGFALVGAHLTRVRKDDPFLKQRHPRRQSAQTRPQAVSASGSLQDDASTWAQPPQKPQELVTQADRDPNYDPPVAYPLDPHTFITSELADIATHYNWIRPPAPEILPDMDRDPNYDPPVAYPLDPHTFITSDLAGIQTHYDWIRPADPEIISNTEIEDDYDPNITYPWDPCTFIGGGLEDLEPRYHWIRPEEDPVDEGTDTLNHNDDDIDKSVSALKGYFDSLDPLADDAKDSEFTSALDGYIDDEIPLEDLLIDVDEVLPPNAWFTAIDTDDWYYSSMLKAFEAQKFATCLHLSLEHLTHHPFHFQASLNTVHSALNLGDTARAHELFQRWADRFRIVYDPAVEHTHIRYLENALGIRTCNGIPGPSGSLEKRILVRGQPLTTHLSARR